MLQLQGIVGQVCLHKVGPVNPMLMEILKEALELLPLNYFICLCYSSQVTPFFLILELVSLVKDENVHMELPQIYRIKIFFKAD